MTIEVVLSNARLLRPIWELTGGAMGYCSLQLSPKMAFDAEAMISEGKWVWEQLTCALDGIPNCVFKLPGTKAGIAVCQELTNCCMGVNITVNFALPQQIAFAGAIESYSNSPVSYRTQMDGRLDDPIGDELKEAGVADWEEVKKWATTAIRQREYKLLCLPPTEGGLGFSQSIPLPASGRGPWNISRSITSGPVPIFLTVFPPRQEEFDAEPREIDPEGMWEALPAGYLDKLYKSELFRKAYEPDGMTVDEFDTYLPVVKTLTGFSEQYDKFVEWVSAK
jgi:transaldolase